MLLDTDLCSLLREYGASQTIVDILRQRGYDVQLRGGHLTAVYGITLANIAPSFFADAINFYLTTPSNNYQGIDKWAIH
jgi:hypothetical protein